MGPLYKVGTIVVIKRLDTIGQIVFCQVIVHGSCATIPSIIVVDDHDTFLGNQGT